MEVYIQCNGIDVRKFTPSVTLFAKVRTMARHRKKGKIYKVSLNPREYDGGKKRYPSSIPKPIGDMIFEKGAQWVAADVVITRTGVRIRPKSGITSYLLCPFCDCKVKNPMRDRWSHCICGVGYMIGKSEDAEGE